MSEGSVWMLFRALWLAICLAPGCQHSAETASAPAIQETDTGTSGSEFVGGQHPTGSRDPETFRPFADGDVLELVFGNQGLFMAVLGLRSQDAFVGVLDLRATLVSGDIEVAKLIRTEVRTVRASDDFDYAWELQLIVDGDIWRGKSATLHIALEDQSGRQFAQQYDVVIGQAETPGRCLAPTPPPTRASDICDLSPGLVHRLDPGGATDAIDIEPSTGEGLLVAARRGNRLLLWESDLDANPVVAHHNGLEHPTSWTDPAGPSAGPWALGLERAGAAMVWGSADGGVWAAAPGRSLIRLVDGEPLAAFRTPDGYKVLVAEGAVVTLHTFDSDHVSVSTHFVVNRASKAGGALATSVENELIVVTFPGLDAEQPLYYQTASIFGGQCSIPSPLGLNLGANSLVEATGLSYGLPIVAITRPPVSERCQPSYRILSKPLSGPGLLDAESAVPWTHGARIVAHDSVATVVGLTDQGGTWQLVAQFTDQQARAPGSVAVGPEVSGDVPFHWDVTRTSRHAVAWSDTGGAWLRRFCFQEPGT